MAQAWPGLQTLPWYRHHKGPRLSSQMTRTHVPQPRDVQKPGTELSLFYLACSLSLGANAVGTQISRQQKDQRGPKAPE